MVRNYAFSLTLGIRQVPLTIPIQYELEVILEVILEVANSIRQETKIKTYRDWGRRNKLVCVHSDMIFYVGNHKEFTKSLLELISDYNKIAIYRFTKQSLIISSVYKFYLNWKGRDE